MGEATTIKCRRCGGLRADCPDCEGGGWVPETHALVAALTVATEMGLPTDVQELLVHGSVSRGVRPGILMAMLRTWDD